MIKVAVDISPKLLLAMTNVMKYKNDITNTFIPEKIFLELAEKYGFKLLEIWQDHKFRFQDYLRMYIFQKE